MDIEALEKDVKRLAELATVVRDPLFEDEAEAVGLAIGLAGIAVISLVRIAAALEAATTIQNVKG